jgi:transglutaminase/protease-like cytokinesis protein 3
VWIRIHKNGVDQPLQDDQVTVKDHSFSKKIALLGGPGQYSIAFWEHKPTDATDVFSEGPSFDVLNTDTEDAIDLFATDQVQSDDPSILAMAKQIVGSATDPLQMTRLIHDWVAKNISYDVPNLLGTIQTDDGLGQAVQISRYELINYTALLTLQSRVAVCLGYANLNAAFHRALKIPARVIDGYFKNAAQTWDQVKPFGVNHAWNEIDIGGGQWILEDTTMDSGEVDPVTMKFYPDFSTKYFNPDPATFALDHQKDGVLYQ